MTNPNNPTNRRIHLDWQDIAFTALPGWVNVCRDDTGAVDTEPCPGVLIQRATTQEVSWDDPNSSNPVRRVHKTEPLDAPETRTVFTYTEGPSIMPLDHTERWYMFSAPADHPNVASAIASATTGDNP